jgi:prepilin-type N-terminal cleavage/methylation domain-containing protein
MQKGFTLIELLLVIAIIAVLSSVIISSLTSARTNAANNAVKSQLVQLRSAAEVMITLNGSYNSLCTPGSETYTMFQKASENSSNGSGTTGLCLSSGTGGGVLASGVATAYSSGIKSATDQQWAASIQMKDGNFYCVDYLGRGRVQASRGIDNSPTDVNCD